MTATLSKPNSNSNERFAGLLSELSTRRERVYSYLFQHEYAARLSPPHIRDAALSYLKLGGKSLRPAVLLLSCGAVGGDRDLSHLDARPR